MDVAVQELLNFFFLQLVTQPLPPKIKLFYVCLVTKLSKERDFSPEHFKVKFEILPSPQYKTNISRKLETLQIFCSFKHIAKAKGY